MTIDRWRRALRYGNLLLGLVAGILLGVGLATYLGTGSASFAAFLALLGVVVTTGVSNLVTWHSDRRLQLDAAMRAGSLLAPSKESTGSSPAAASGLLALTKLDHAELAVALLVELWSHRSTSESAVSNETAILVIDAALREDQGASNAPLVAAELLCRNATKLDACQSLHWPSSIDGRWLPSLGPKTKLLLLDGLVNMTTTSDARESALRSLAVRLYGIWKGDSDEHVKGCVGVLIKTIVPVMQKLKYQNFMQGAQSVTMNQLERAADTAAPNPDEYLARIVSDRSKSLNKWATECEHSFEVGALGDSLCPNPVNRATAVGSPTMALPAAKA